MSLDAISLPGGWGYPPGFTIHTGAVVDALPNLPMIKLLRGQQKNDVIVGELIHFPRFREVRQSDLQKKYGLPASTANVILQRARRYA